MHSSSERAVAIQATQRNPSKNKPCSISYCPPPHIVCYKEGERLVLWTYVLQTRSGPEGSSRRKAHTGHEYQPLTH